MKRRKIAIVDDDEVFLEALCAALGDSFEIDPMTSSDELVNYIKSNPQNLDAIFVDLSMPDTQNVSWHLGGLTAIREIRRRLGAKSPSINVLSGMDSLVHCSTCLKNGADAFIEKTHLIEDVARKMRRSLLQSAA